MSHVGMVLSWLQALKNTQSASIQDLSRIFGLNDQGAPESFKGGRWDLYRKLLDGWWEHKETLKKQDSENSALYQKAKEDLLTHWGTGFGHQESKIFLSERGLEGMLEQVFHYVCFYMYSMISYQNHIDEHGSDAEQKSLVFLRQSMSLKFGLPILGKTYPTTGNMASSIPECFYFYVYWWDVFTKMFFREPSEVELKELFTSGNKLIFGLSALHNLIGGNGWDILLESGSKGFTVEQKNGTLSVKISSYGETMLARKYEEDFLLALGRETNPSLQVKVDELYERLNELPLLEEKERAMRQQILRGGRVIPLLEYGEERKGCPFFKRSDTNKDERPYASYMLLGLQDIILDNIF
jgi:hypothetical protein